MRISCIAAVNALTFASDPAARMNPRCAPDGRFSQPLKLAAPLSQTIFLLLLLLQPLPASAQNVGGAAPPACDAARLFEAGVSHFNAGRFPLAADSFANASRCRPDYAAAFNGLGVSHAARGRHAEALAYFTEAVRLAPNMPYAHGNFGRALFFTGKFEEGGSKPAFPTSCHPSPSNTCASSSICQMTSSCWP
jgi:tetratricopeptide (TPR) repeat protein